MELKLRTDLATLLSQYKIKLDDEEFNEFYKSIVDNYKTENKKINICRFYYYLNINDVRKAYQEISEFKDDVKYYKFMNDLVTKMEYYFKNVLKIPNVITENNLQELLLSEITNIDDLIDIYLLYTSNIKTRHIDDYELPVIYINYAIVYSIIQGDYAELDKYFSRVRDDKNKYLLLTIIYNNVDTEKVIEYQKILLEDYQVNTVSAMFENYKKINKMQEFYTYVFSLSKLKKQLCEAIVKIADLEH